MSDNLGKRIKVIAVIIGTVGAVTGFAAALKYFSEGNLFFACVFLIYAILSIMLMIPLFLAGSSADAIEAENKKLRNLSDKIAMIEKSSRYATSPIDKYSPVAGRRRAPASDTSDDDVAPMGVATAERKVAPYPSGELSSSKGSIELESEKEMGTIKSVFASSSDRIDSDTLITDIPKPSMKSEAESAFYTTSSIDMIKVNRKDNSVTRFLAPSSSTIAAGGLHTVAVTETGKVLAAGYGTYGQCNVSAWTSIVSVAAGNHHTVGLRSNGTCVATGYSGYGQCEVDMWRNVCAVSAGVGHTVGLLENGTCVATGDNTYGQCNVSDWEGIIAISAGYNYTVGLRADGTIVAVGYNGYGQCNVSEWQNVVAIAAGRNHTVGLTRSGILLSTGDNTYGQCNLRNFTDIKINK